MQDIYELDKKGLREFGLVSGLIIAALFGLLLPWLFNLDFPLWPWVLTGVLVVWAVIAPATMRGLYRIWMRFGLLLSKVTTPIIIGLVFYLAITPTALIMRIFSRDPMNRAFDKNLDSYRIPSRHNDKSHIEKPF